jgi:type III secretion protein J
VELVIPEPPRPGQAAAPSKASVLLRVRSERTENLRNDRDELRSLIAASVEGLRSEDVTLVIDTVAAHVSAAALARPSERRTTWALIVSGALALIMACVTYLVIHLRRKSNARARINPQRRATPYGTERQTA